MVPQICATYERVLRRATAYAVVRVVLKTVCLVIYRGLQRTPSSNESLKSEVRAQA